MSFSHKLFLAGGAAIFLLGMTLVVVKKTSIEQPPDLVRPSRIVQARIQNPSMSAEMLSGPWFRRSPVVVAPASKPALAPVLPDTMSVKYLGTSTDRNGTQMFFFKHVPSDQVIILKLGETRNGWTLKALTDQTFSLLGSGGAYEVQR
jgi:hypothetical protein